MYAGNCVISGMLNF